MPQAVGFMASDNFDEMPESVTDELLFCDVASSPSTFVLATTVERATSLRQGPISIATSYPRLAQRALVERGYDVADMFVADGSIEAADGLVDAIVDVCNTGKTLGANSYVVVERDLCAVSLGIVVRRSL